MDRLKFPIAVIAGGKSTRFGGQKLNVEFNGLTLIENAVKIAGKISNKVFIITGDSKILLHDDWLTFADLVPDCGPIGGIYTALKMIESDWIAVMPADMPFLIPEIYGILNENRSSDRPVVAVSDSGIEPLVSLWPSSVIDTIENLLKNREYKIFNSLKMTNAVEVLLSGADKSVDSSAFFNINSRSDLDKIK